MGKPLTPPKRVTAMSLIENGMHDPRKIDYYLHEEVVGIIRTAKGTKREPLVIKFWNSLSPEIREYYRACMSALPGSELADILVMLSPSRRLRKQNAAAA